MGAGLGDGARDAARMTLLAENENDIGEIALARAGDHIGRARAVAAHAHVERSVEAEGEAALGAIELHGRDAEVEHHAVGFREAGIVRGVIEIGKPLLDQREAAIGGLHQIRAGRDRALVAIDADNFAIGGGEDGARIAAGAEGGVDIDAAVMHVEHGKRRRAQHRNMAGHAACDSRRAAALRAHSDAPRMACAAKWASREWAKAAKVAGAAQNTGRSAILAEKSPDFMGYNGH